MPVNIFNDAALTTISGPVTIAKDARTGDAAALNVSGTVSVSGLITAASGINAVGSMSASSGLNVAGGLVYDSITGGIPATSTTQSIAVASGTLITMTGSGRIIRVSCSALTTSTSLTPTASTLTNSTFSNGQEVTLLNVAIGGSNISIAAVGTGAAYVLVGLTAAKFMYVADLQSWIHQA
jgi:hypothetical protein